MAHFRIINITFLDHNCSWCFHHFYVAAGTFEANFNLCRCVPTQETGLQSCQAVSLSMELSFCQYCYHNRQFSTLNNSQTTTQLNRICKMFPMDITLKLLFRCEYRKFATCWLNRWSKTTALPVLCSRSERLSGKSKGRQRLEIPFIPYDNYQQPLHSAIVSSANEGPAFCPVVMEMQSQPC